MIEFEAVIALMILFAAFLLGSVGLGFVLGRTTLTKPAYGDLWSPLPDEDGDDVEEPEEPQGQEHATLPVDPANPPSWRVYNPKREDAEPKFCICHREEIARGSKVLWWPNPETQGVDLLCERGVEEAESLKDITG